MEFYVVRRGTKSKRERIKLSGSGVVEGVKVHYITRKEAIRVYNVMQPTDPEPERIRNYEFESILRSWTGLGESDETFVINEWCPFNGVWCAWTRYMPIEEVHRIIADPDFDPSARDYVKRTRIQ